MNDIDDTTAGDDAGPGPAPSPEPRPAAGPPPPVRRLVRSRADRKVAGVAGGLGAYFGVDPVIFRLGLVLATFFGGAGVLAYAIAWIVLPEGDTTAAAGSMQRGEDDASSLISLIVGGFLLVLGLATLFDLTEFGFLWPASWPVALIAAGIAVIVWARRRDGTDPAAGTAADPTTPRPETGEGTAAAPVVPDDDLLPVPYTGGGVASPGAATRDDAGGADAGDDGGDGGDGDPGGGDLGGGDEPPGAPTGPAAPAPTPRHGGISATALAVAGIFLFVGLATLGHLADWWDLALGTVFGGALILCGAGLLASMWLGRGLLLIPLGILCALALVAASWIDVPLRGGVGERTAVPVALSDVDEPIRLAIGSLELDLSHLDFEGPVEVEASVAVGELRIVVPDDVALDVDASAGVGQVVLEGTGISPFTRNEGGIGSTIDQRFASEVRPDDVLRLEADVGLGQVIIQRVPAGDRPDDGAVRLDPLPASSTTVPAASSEFDR